MKWTQFLNCKMKIMNGRELNLTRMDFSRYRAFKTLSSLDKSSQEALIIENTVVSDDHLTPEIKLRLITPDCELWHCKSTESKFDEDPFWGIYWPGGQALGRFILNNKQLFSHKNVLEIGSGSGACAIAAAKSGANIVLANDIDALSLVAINLNSQLNNVKIKLIKDNLIAENIDNISVIQNNTILKPKWDILLIGDMFYDSQFSKKLFIWLCGLVNKGKMVFIGDPGRVAFNDLSDLKNFGTLVKIAEYSFNNTEHNGFPNAFVYKVVKNKMCKV